MTRLALLPPTVLPPTVVDASVGVKWVIQEENTSHAISLIRAGHRLIVPDRFYSEVANVLWKRTRRATPSERITEQEAREGLETILGIPLEVIPSAVLVSNALEIALEIGHLTYDCDYLALALLEGAEFVTADAKMYRKLSTDDRYSPVIRWIDPVRGPFP